MIYKILSNFLNTNEHWTTASNFNQIIITWGLHYTHGPFNPNKQSLYYGNWINNILYILNIKYLEVTDHSATKPIKIILAWMKLWAFLA